MSPESILTRSSTESRVERFRRDGCVVLRGLIDAPTVEQLSAWIDELVARPEVPGRHMVYYEDSLRTPGERILSRIENFCPFHDGLREFVTGPDTLGLLATLFEEPAVLFKDKINFKRPGCDGFKAHQDVQAGWDDYASLFVTMFVGIEETTEENGCLHLAPGPDRRDVGGKRWEPLGEDLIAGLDFQPFPTLPGDVILFDSFVPHLSLPNRTANQRRVLYATYNRLSEGDHRERYYADKRASYPPDCERDPDRDYAFRV
jgi:ectoine hydroxylase-related dioxygenase (phytanoyl-CoA dioxygenase family)